MRVLLKDLLILDHDLMACSDLRRDCGSDVLSSSGVRNSICFMGFMDGSGLSLAFFFFLPPRLGWLEVRSKRLFGKNSG